MSGFARKLRKKAAAQKAARLPTVSRDYLTEKPVKMVGFSFGPHPIEPDYLSHITVYRTGEDDYTLCSTRVKINEVDVEFAREQLGTEIAGTEVAHLAVARHVQKVSFERLKDMLLKGIPDATFEWHEETEDGTTDTRS